MSLFKEKSCSLILFTRCLPFAFLQKCIPRLIFLMYFFPFLVLVVRKNNFISLNTGLNLPFVSNYIEILSSGISPKWFNSVALRIQIFFFDVLFSFFFWRPNFICFVIVCREKFFFFSRVFYILELWKESLELWIVAGTLKENLPVRYCLFSRVYWGFCIVIVNPRYRFDQTSEVELYGMINSIWSWCFLGYPHICDFNMKFSLSAISCCVTDEYSQKTEHIHAIIMIFMNSPWLW